MLHVSDSLTKRKELSSGFWKHDNEPAGFIKRRESVELVDYCWLVDKFCAEGHVKGSERIYDAYYFQAELQELISVEEGERLRMFHSAYRSCLNNN
jgi:hypothetical protein